MADRLRAGDFDDDRPPARIHGDLWSGNVVFTADGVVMIDPAAHGGHGLTDLAMLHVFGVPGLDRISAAYAEEARLEPGWRDADRAAPAAPAARARREPRAGVRRRGRLRRPPVPLTGHPGRTG